LNSLLYFLRIVVMTSSSFDYMVPLTGCPFFLGKFILYRNIDILDLIY
jgi:hypothetical protein